MHAVRVAARFKKYSRGNHAARVSNRVRGRIRCAVDISTLGSAIEMDERCQKYPNFF